MPAADETKTDSPVDAAKQQLGGRKPTDAANNLQLSQRPENDKVKGKDGKGGNDDDDKSSLKIKISLDLEVEVHLTARIKGDITIGLL